MSQQLALSSLFSVLALASLALAAGNDGIGGENPASMQQMYSAQAELAPDLRG